ncbi:helix-turn-helix transcriptional regulator [Christiangramia sp. SM2212]|uniref:Helix-turn-helix transcriptional regulator n=1 Tax=Christiangramia sediminicola TaxID=3073267 RepID=A0ABU1EPH2_9FLAO|nr:helix-turn-helix transcriptional regulator [Christiangramia sp. SM2212]MDR5590294.1 helix-turn-helix transcriptional regulator [Christiangramia sp. SM2212]
MISNFAKPIDYPIPEQLVEFVLYSIYGKSENKLNVVYPMFANGFPLIVWAEDIPEIITDSFKRLPESKLNIAGQIYNSNISVAFNDQFLDAIGVILSPAAPYYLFHQSAQIFLNRWTGLDKVSPIKADKLISNTENAEITRDKLERIYDYLIQLEKNRLEPIPWLDRSLRRILESQGVIEIREIIEKEEISERHFRRKFQEIIGMPPKYYCKVIQITSVFQLLQQKETSENLTQVALDCGYFDQSHFIKDFKKYIGLSPNNFLNSEYSFISTYLGAH